jgi:two-component system chemotaxis response regulator CheY
MRRVLIVDDNSDHLELLSRYLADENHSIQTASDSAGCLHRLRAWKPHLIILDQSLPDGAGVDLIPKIRAASVDDYVSIILISAGSSLEEISKGLEAGADDYLTQPFRPQELVTRARAMLKLKDVHDSLRRANSRIDELASTDDLTGVLNMRTLYRRGEEEILRSRRMRKPISALLLNLDKFSIVNQNFGFPFGNNVLLETGRRIQQCLRSIDAVARVGADEFFVLLIETDLANAEFMAERIHDAIQSTAFRDGRDAKESSMITASIGVGSVNWDQADQQMSDLFHVAAEALRSAKSNGANQIEIHSFV